MTITSKDVERTKRGTKPDGTQGTTGEVHPAPSLPSQLEDLSNNENENKVLMKMDRDNYSWVSPSGVLFTKELPYQLVDEDVVQILLPHNFRRAVPEEVIEYYNK